MIYYTKQEQRELNPRRLDFDDLVITPDGKKGTIVKRGCKWGVIQFEDESEKAYELKDLEKCEPKQLSLLALLEVGQ